MSLINFIEGHKELKKSNELIFFGGSFNPWHSGHLSCLKLLPAKKIVIITPDHNPYKDLRKADQDYTNIDTIERETKNLDLKVFTFKDFYLKKESNPTYRWIEEIHSQYPEKKLFLLLGFDSFMGIDKWIEAPSLLNNLSGVYIASRLDNKEQKEEQIVNLTSIANQLKIKFLGHHDYEDITSTQLRNKKGPE